MVNGKTGVLIGTVEEAEVIKIMMILQQNQKAVVDVPQTNLGHGSLMIGLGMIDEHSF